MWHKQGRQPKLSFMDCAASEGVELCPDASLWGNSGILEKRA